MPARLVRIAALAAVGLTVLAAGGATAADPAPAVSLADASGAHIALLRQAVPDGWVEGQFTAWNDAGEQTDADNRPECTSGPGHEDLPNMFGGMIKAFSDGASCTVTAYEPGSLRFGMVCNKDGKSLAYDASGSFSAGQIDFLVKLKATGPDAPDLGSMRLVAKRVRDCTADELAKAAKHDPET
ncbi:hypothetical protein [Novosphingobium sp.]|uniref:hypothetical protein n=1 Tax=Novosphingobium sp. TaxID=1874826 RepID=UPI0035AF31AC